MLPTTKAGIRFHACSGGAAGLAQLIQDWRTGLEALCPRSLSRMKPALMMRTAKGLPWQRSSNPLTQAVSAI